MAKPSKYIISKKKYPDARLRLDIITVGLNVHVPPDDSKPPAESYGCDRTEEEVPGAEDERTAESMDPGFWVKDRIQIPGSHIT